jgi:hypothetical protein
MTTAQEKTVAILKGYKEVLAKLREVWGVDVGMRSVMKWCESKIDPLPIKRISPTNTLRPIIIADATAVEAWARRQVK